MAKKPSFHEDLSRDETPKLGSERAFGLVFAVVFAIIALWPLLDAGTVRLWAAGIAGFFCIAAFVAPRLLAPLNVVWFKFGLLLHKIVNPLVMGLLFYFTVTPIALIMRALGKDPLQRQFDAEAASYWVHRDPPGPAPETMKNQF